MKRFDMKKICLLTATLSTFAVLAACGDDVTNDSVVRAESYAEKGDLPDCAKYEGMFATIPSKNEVYFCTQKKWLPVVSGTSASKADSAGLSTCSTVELSDKSGYKVVCGGDSLAVVKNGKKGDQGDPGAAGTPGDKGKEGDPGKKGADGKDLTLDSTKWCVTRYFLNDVIVYECIDSTYVVNATDRASALETWRPYSLSSRIYTATGHSYQGEIRTVYEQDGTGSKSSGTLVRWEGDNWTPDTLSYGYMGMLKNDAISGTATMTVQAGATPNEKLGTEPFVGLRISVLPKKWGGLCLTYTSDLDMDVIAWADSGKTARVKLEAAAEETTVDFWMNQFIPDNENVSLDTIFMNASYWYIVLAGGLDAGTYENNFAIYEIGQYGKCGGDRPTIDEIKEKILEAKGDETPDLSDGRIDPMNPEIYKTVKIGDRVWMAENLRIPYNFKSDDGDDDPDTDNGDDMALCPTDADTLAKYGCLYTWAAAMDSAGRLNGTTGSNSCGYDKACTATAPVRGICPEGWHLPSKAEAEALFNAASYDGVYPQMSYPALRGSSEDNMDWLGFSLVASGYTYDLSSVNYQGFYSYLWTSDIEDDWSAVDFILDFSTVGNDYFNYDEKYYGMSVRCVQDVEEE